MENHTLLQAKKTLQEKGWVIIKGVFSVEEIQDFRKRASLSGEQGYSSTDLLSNPNLRDVLLDKRITSIVQNFLGAQPVYFGDSGYQIASHVGRISNGFHKDNTDKQDKNAPDWTSPFTLLRVGLYLQDHSKHAEGLVVRTGSHKTVSCSEGKKENVRSEAGDLIVWYLTTTHSGNARPIKWFDYPVVVGSENAGWLASRLHHYLPNFCFEKSEKDRMAMFMTFGIDDHHLDRYLKYLKRRDYMVKLWRASNFPENVEALASKSGIKVLNLPNEIKHTNIDESQFLSASEQFAY